MFFTATWTEKTLETTCDRHFLGWICWNLRQNPLWSTRRIYPMGQMLHWSIHRHKAECDNSWRFRSPVPTLENYTHRPFLLSACWSRSCVKQAACFPFVETYADRLNCVCWFVFVCACRATAVQGPQGLLWSCTCTWRIARDCDCKQFVCIFLHIIVSAVPEGQHRAPPRLSWSTKNEGAQWSSEGLWLEFRETEQDSNPVPRSRNIQRWLKSRNLP